MSMPRIHLVHLEDDPLDAELVRARLAQEGIDCSLVLATDADSFEAALAHEPDAVLADYAVPGFHGLSAYRQLQARWPDVPFVLVSGSLGEERAVEALREGATDYVLKHRLLPLGNAVRRAIAEAEERRARRRAEAQLKALNAELEARVHERTRELEQANETLARREEQLRHSEEFLASVVTHVPDVMFVKDARSLRYVRCNHAMEELLGRPANEIVDRSDDDLFPPAHAHALVARDRAALRSTEVDIREETMWTARNGWRTFHTKRVPIVDGEGRLTYVLGIARDITERRMAEHVLKHARDTAERANSAKNEFLSRMSHEFRTPLNAILGFAQLFQTETLSPEHAENVQQIARAGQHLLQLITEVLDISRIESGSLAASPEPVDVAELVGDVTRWIHPSAALRDISVHVESRHRLVTMADHQWLRQILLNVCSNAVKYNRNGGSVRITYARVDAGIIRIAVADEGPGIPQEKLPLLFTPFERLGAERSGIEGTGLGLAVCKRLADAMGGRLGCDSRVGHGSTFFIDLPECPEPDRLLARTGERNRLPDAASAPHTVAGRVLYIEDVAANVRLMQRLLARRPGVTLLHAPDAATGLGLVESQQPDLVMLDLRLPDMTGEDVLRRILTVPPARRPQVLVLSADAMEARRAKMLAAGAHAYLTKPIDFDAVLAVVDDVLRRRRAADDAGATRLAVR